MALSCLVALSISSFHNLDIKANTVYSMIELIYFMMHRFLQAVVLSMLFAWSYIDSEINHIRHLITIQFVNKGIEFINLPCMLKDKSVISSIPI